MRIYIRHAEKIHRNGQSETLKFDPDITPEGREEARILSENLIKKYGFPSKIVCSPYRRTRQTVLEMVSVIEHYNRDQEIPIYCDISLSEFLGNHKHEELDVDPITKYWDPPHPESYHNFKIRIQKHNETFKKLDSDISVIWFITHGIVLRQLSVLFGQKEKPRIYYLSCLCLTKWRKWIEYRENHVPIIDPSDPIPYRHSY